MIGIHIKLFLKDLNKNILRNCANEVICPFAGGVRNCTDCLLKNYADRIEAVKKRERAISNALLAIKGKMIPHPDPENAPPPYPGNAAALRNCDVGTAEEQYRRFRTMCDSKDAKQCSTCMFRQNCYTSRDKCFARWAQLPYEAEKKGGVE